MISCAGACTVTLVISAAPATPEQYDAINLIFAGVLVALCLVWGAKQLLRLFHNPPDA